MTNLNYGYMEVHMLSTDYDMGVRLVKLFVHGWKYMVGQIWRHWHIQLFFFCRSNPNFFFWVLIIYSEPFAFV